MESQPQLTLEAKTTALVLIDLQQGIVAHNTAPHTTAEVIERGVKLANKFRQAGATVVLVHVNVSEGGHVRPNQNVHAPMPSAGSFPPNWAEFVPQLNIQSTDIKILKHQWGAFYGTELDLQLRRRGVKTIVIGGISTNFGVESTARDAWERNYNMVFAEDAMASQSGEAHQFAVKTIFPRLGRVRSTDQILAALK